MPRFYIPSKLPGRYYQFAARATAYPPAILPGLGVIPEADLPANAEVEEHLTRDRYAEFPILQLRLSLKNGRSVVRLASALAPINTLIGADVFGSEVNKVRPARQRVRV
ncbi:hypothetical protein IQ250_20890 [Pseudanabaenaceae cyanobacterium LEGE 13415]|nr:hypothetical protein [Pseudanabaenaceae cyanobacterium LEGE 13415]